VTHSAWIFNLILQAGASRPKMADVPGDLRLRPKSVKAPHGARVLSITWADGHTSSYPHEILRGFCPCAGCQGHGGPIRYQANQNLDLVEIEQVGNYALGFRWADGHASGIYTFRYLRRLSELIEAQGADGVIAMGELPRV
jgi:DUF971 family protein